MSSFFYGIVYFQHMKFVIQTVSGRVIHDFAFALERNLEYQAWRGNPCEVAYADIWDLEKHPDCIPVGSVEFVTRYCNIHVRPDATIRPLNIPGALRRYRAGLVTSREDITKDAVYYRKSTERIKDPGNGTCDSAFVTQNFDGPYQFTVMEDVTSEWRVFINRGNMLDGRCYSGDFTAAPDWNVVREMLSAWNYDGPATVDVFVNAEGVTQVMECHEFWSCGTYGFEHPSLAQMFSHAFFNLKQQILKQ